MGNDRIRYRAEATPWNIVNPLNDYSWAPSWWYKAFPNSPSGDMWASKSFQALLLGGALALAGYGSRKILRGTQESAQDAFKAVRKYMPNDASFDINSDLLVDDDEEEKDKKKKKKKDRKASVKEGEDIEFSVPPQAAMVLPLGASLLGWLVGQRLANNEIRDTETKNAEGNLALARYNYEQELASKIDPNFRKKKKKLKKRIANPIDYAVDKVLSATGGLGDKFYKKADDQFTTPPEDTNMLKQMFKSGVEGTANLAESAMSLDRFGPAFAAAIMLIVGKYAWNNYRSRDKNTQKALDVEAALKRRAMYSNKAKLDINRILGKKSKEYMPVESPVDNPVLDKAL